MLKPSQRMSLIPRSVLLHKIPYIQEHRYLYRAMQSLTHLQKLKHQDMESNGFLYGYNKRLKPHMRELNKTFHAATTKLADVSQESPEMVLSQISFKNTQSIYAAVTTSELIKSGVILTSLRFKLLFQNASFMLNMSQKILGKPLTMLLVKHTLFKHFCGGENLPELLHTGIQLAKRQIGTIVDYSAESEDTTDSTQSEAWLDANADVTMDGITHSAELRDTAKNDFAFLALKVTSMCRPHICRKVTACLNTLHTLYSTKAGVDNRVSIYNPAHHDILCEKPLSNDQVTQLLESTWTSFSKNEIQAMVNEMTQLYSNHFDNSGFISYIQFMGYFTPEKIASLPSPTIQSDPELTNKLKDQYWLQKEDVDQWALASQRFDKCFELAKEKSVRLLVDAEQTFYQSAIDAVATVAMEKHCKIPHPDLLEQTPALSYNTYQLYLKNSLGKLKYEMHRAKVLGYRLGAKVVRGAYINQETKCSEKIQYENPIHESIQQTHAAYESAIEYVLTNLPSAELLCGTHNETSITKAAKRLGELSGNEARKYPVTFAQLLGMCDYMSLQLGRVGARSYKYVPYGPVDLVLPYLIRRAEENSSIFGSATKESKLVWKEVSRRALTSLGVM